MSSIVLRTCNSEKGCSKCEKMIQVGEKYYSGPYKSLCLECHELEKKEAVDPKKVNDSYVVSGSCQHCDLPAVGILWGIKVCAAHINQAITDSI